MEGGKKGVNQKRCSIREPRFEGLESVDLILDTEVTQSNLHIFADRADPRTSE